MTVHNSLAVALGALAVSVTLAAATVPAVAVDTAGCAGAAAAMPDHARRAGLTLRFLDGSADCRIELPPAQSLVGPDSADASARSRGRNVYDGQGGGSPTAPVVVPIRR